MAGVVCDKSPILEHIETCSITGLGIDFLSKTWLKCVSKCLQHHCSLSVFTRWCFHSPLMTMQTFPPSLLWHCWLGDRKGIRPVKTGCWFVGGDDSTVALHVLELQLSPPLPSSLAPIKSRIRVPANAGPPGKRPLKQTGRGRDRVNIAMDWHGCSDFGL